MTTRNLSPQRMFTALAAEHEPTCRFTGQEDFATWRQRTWPKVLATLGDSPPAVEPNPELLAEWSAGPLTCQRWVLDVGPHISATLRINYPDAKLDQPRPAICCWHGHGREGKAAVMGDVGGTSLEEIQRHNYDYGRQMAEAGFVTYAIDWFGVGERNDSQKPNFLKQNGQRDWCNLYYLQATMLGMTSLSINLAHGRAATDFVATLPGVDGSRLGVMGLSGGGTMTLWTALTDDRFAAAEIICYSDLWEIFGFRYVNFCGMQVAPGLFKLVNLPDLQGLLAPKPLLVDIGTDDRCFRVDEAMACYRRVEEIYRAAAGDDAPLELDLFPGDHAWGGNRSVDFFRRHLGT